MQIAANKAVSIEYTLTNDAGEVLDTSTGGEPLVYLHGAGNIIPGLERELDGKQVGDELKVTIEPEDAYGEFSPSWWRCWAATCSKVWMSWKWACSSMPLRRTVACRSSPSPRWTAMK